MSNPSSDSYRNVTRYQGQDYSFAPRYIRPRDPISPTNASPDIKPKEQQGHYPTGSFWTNSTNGNLWALQKITNNLANWILLSGGASGPILSVPIDASTAPGTNPVIPTGPGALTIEGGVAYATNTRSSPIRTNSLAANTIDLEIQLAGANAATANANRFGVSQFDDNQFDVTSGFVQLAGGGTAPALTKIVVQTGTIPVVPTSTGQITFNGALVAAGTNPVRSDGAGANTMALEVQTSQALAAADSTKVGLSNFKSTQFSVDSNGFVTSLGNIINQGYSNLGISQTAGTTFTVNGFDGTALSASNPAIVYLQSLATPGRLIKYTVTANQAFTQGQIATNNFGLTNGLAFATDVPFFLYAVSNGVAGVSPETSIAFMISRYPNATLSPVAGKIGQSASALAQSQGSFFSLLSPITAADYASSPCLCIGSFRMRWDAANNWTIQTINPSDGIGNYQDNILFASIAGHFGAAANSFFYANGGTAPIFTSQAITYYIGRDGLIYIQSAFTTATTPGLGAVSLNFALPFLCNGGSVIGGGLLDNSANAFVMASQVSPVNTNKLIFVINAASPGVVFNATVAANSSLATNATFKALFS